MKAKGERQKVGLKGARRIGHGPEWEPLMPTPDQLDAFMTWFCLAQAGLILLAGLMPRP